MPHTPGPWRVDETKALGAYGVWTDYLHPSNPGDDGTGFPVEVCSVVACGKGHKGQEIIDRQERDANARLMAAAPDLLAACKRAREVLGIQMASDLRGFTREEKDEIIRGHIDIKEIDAAIAKAEGTTPTPKGA